MKFVLALVGLVQLIASCVPNTPAAPPDAQLPSVYRGDASTAASLGNVPWQKLYDDPVLQDLIRKALAHNFNVAIAYANILQAEANLGHHRSESIGVRQRPRSGAVLGHDGE